MNFGELRTEFLARGFDYLSTTRADRYINQAYGELCEMERWPFLEKTTTGAAPLTISDLGAVASVLDADRNAKLNYIDRRTLFDIYKDLSTTGEPRWYYIEDGKTLKTYPVGGTLNVRYWIVPAELSGDTDAPVVPTRFHNLIVDLAVRRAYIDSDNFEAAQALQAEADRGMTVMAQSLLAQQHGGQDFIVDVDNAMDW